MRVGRAIVARGRRLRRLLTRSALVLVCHRVARVDVDPWELSVSPEHFAEHLAVSRRRGRPISLRAFVQSARRGSLPRGSIVHFAKLPEGDYIGMHATVLFDRAVLQRAGGHDRRLRACADYDVYLRIA